MRHRDKALSVSCCVAQPPSEYANYCGRERIAAGAAVVVASDPRSDSERTTLFNNESMDCAAFAIVPALKGFTEEVPEAKLFDALLRHHPSFAEPAGPAHVLRNHSLSFQRL